MHDSCWTAIGTALLPPVCPMTVPVGPWAFGAQAKVKLSLLDLPFLPDELRPLASPAPNQHHDAEQRLRA
jgi:hypothetical protein